MVTELGSVLRAEVDMAQGGGRRGVGGGNERVSGVDKRP